MATRLPCIRSQASIASLRTGLGAGFFYVMIDKTVLFWTNARYTCSTISFIATSMQSLHRHKKKAFAVAGLLTAFVGAASFVIHPWGEVGQAAETRSVTLPFHYAFSSDTITPEKHPLEKSSSPYWWVNSGAYMYLKGGEGMTVQGELPTLDPRRVSYGTFDPIETDGGYHPQNVFRLILRTTWQDSRQEMRVKLNKYNLSDSPERTASNGVLLFSRYIDGNNLYYAGLRVDGSAIIKKKYGGKYFTMAEVRGVLPGAKYDRSANPNLLPLGTWIGLRVDTANKDDGKVSLMLYADIGMKGEWTLVASVVDDGVTYGGPALTESGHTGLRTDFMDAVFDDYRLSLP